MAFRLFWRALDCLLLAFAWTWGHVADFDPWGDVLRWMPYALLAFAMLLAAVASLRLMRRETRGALICNCGGLLGTERKGPLGRYRKCAACGRHHALRE